MRKRRKAVRNLCMVLCLCIGLVPFGNPKAAYGAGTGGKAISEIEITATVDDKTSWDKKHNADFYQKIMSEYDDAYGNPNSPLEIKNAGELGAFAKAVNEGKSFEGKYVQLADKIDNIDLEGSGLTPRYAEADADRHKMIIEGTVEHAWVPIGREYKTLFQGTFDGNGCKITGMVVLNQSTQKDQAVYSGFFGMIGDKGAVKGLEIEGGSVVSSAANESRAGGLVGNNNGGSIESSYATGTVTSSSSSSESRAGGLVGNNNGGSIESSYATGAVTSSSSSDFNSFSRAGGLVGYNGGSISSSYATGAVTSSSGFSNAGGLVGENGGSITDSYRNAEAAIESKQGSGQGTIIDAGTALSPEEMTGADGAGRAKERMVGFGSDWFFRADGSISPLGNGRYSQTRYYPIPEALKDTLTAGPSYVKEGYRLSDCMEVTITGTMKADQALTAQVSQKTDAPLPVQESALQYRWYVGGNPVSGAQGATYRVKANDVGKEIQVIVTCATHLGEASAKIIGRIYYQVTVAVPTDGHMTRDKSQGEANQTCAAGQAMEPVVYRVDPGYTFPSNYSVAGSNGIQVRRTSSEQISVSGTPTANTRLTLKRAVKVAPPVQEPTTPPVQKPKAPVVQKPKAPTIRTSATYNRVKVSWKKVSGAAGYQVYRATKQNGNYKRVKTTAKSSWNNKKLTTGKAYYYKVRAYKKVNNKRVYGRFSKQRKAVPRTKAPQFRLTAGNNKMRISWKKAAGADGYRIYRARSKKGKYQMIKDARSRVRSYTSIGLTDHHRYYYKMRSYKLVKGKKVYSAYSQVKSKRTR